MYIFISYAREDAELAQRLNAALNAAGFNSFLDTVDLHPGYEFNQRIKDAVENADLFIFLASHHSISPGSYALSELTFAEAKWRNPTGYVLPVITVDLDPGSLPAYLRPVTALQVHGDLIAEVIGWVYERSTKGGDPLLSLLDPNKRRLEQFVQSAQPPLLHDVNRGCLYAFIYIGGLLSLIITIIFGILIQTSSGGDLSPEDYLAILLCVLIIAAVIRNREVATLSFKGLTNPTAAIVLDVTFVAPAHTIVRLQLHGKKQPLSVTTVTDSEANAVPGLIGWAYIRNSELLDFLPAEEHKTERGSR